jgi:hypothetical protein
LHFSFPEQSTAIRCFIEAGSKRTYQSSEESAMSTLSHKSSKLIDTLRLPIIHETLKKYELLQRFNISDKAFF